MGGRGLQGPGDEGPGRGPPASRGDRAEQSRTLGMSIDSLAAWSSSSWSADPPWAAAAQREALTAAGASWWRTRREFLDPELLSRPMFQMTALAGAGMTWGLRAATRGTREVRGGWAARHTAPRGRGDRRRGRHRHQHDERVDGAGPPGGRDPGPAGGPSHSGPPGGHRALEGPGGPERAQGRGGPGPWTGWTSPTPLSSRAYGELSGAKP